MEREELIKALRCCTSGPSVADCKDKCTFYKGADMSLCIPEMGSVAADTLENDRNWATSLQCEIEKLRAENAALRSQVDVAILEGD